MADRSRNIPPRVVFCHGVPGSPEDARLLTWPGTEAPLVPNLLTQGGDPLGGLGDLLGRSERDAGVLHLIGFSLGAMVALRLAARHPRRIAKVTLISAAAPLSLGDFLPHMAGAPVFRLAAQAPALFRAVTRAQGALANHAQGLLLRQLFASAHGSERALLQDPAARQVLTAALRNSYCANRAGYRTWVRLYTRDWRDDLARVTCPVTLWHGAEDSWAPPEMSEALAQAISGPTRVIRLPQTGHYGALRAADIT